MKGKAYWVMVGLLMATMLSIGISKADNQTFTLNPTSINITLTSGSFGTFGIKILNPDNTSLILNATGEGNASKFLFFSNSIIVDSNSSKDVFIGYFISPISLPKIYDMGIRFNNTVFNVTFVVVDTLLPEIGKCELSDTKTNQTLPIKVRCINIVDNIEISSVIGEARRENKTKLFNLTQESFGVYGGTFALEEIGEYSIFITAIDIANNAITKNIANVTINKHQPLSIVEKISNGHLKFNTTHTRNLGYIGNPINLTVFVENFGYIDQLTFINNTFSYSKIPIAFKLKIGEEPSRNVLPNSTQIFPNAHGFVNLEIFGSDQGEFSGRMVFNSLGDNFTSEISGSISYFTVPQPYVFEWFGKLATCFGVDQDTMENSTLNCQFIFPIDSGDFIPAPKMLFEDSLRLKENYLIEKAKSTSRLYWNWIFGVIIAILLLIIIIIWVKISWE